MHATRTGSPASALAAATMARRPLTNSRAHLIRFPPFQTGRRRIIATPRPGRQRGYPQSGAGAERVARYPSWSRARKGGPGNVGGASVSRSQGGLGSGRVDPHGRTRTDTEAWVRGPAPGATMLDLWREDALRAPWCPFVSFVEGPAARCFRGSVGGCRGWAGYWARRALRASRGRRRPRTIATAAARTRSMTMADHKVAGARLRQRVRKK